jgi:signal transduction histidine kinase
MPLREVDKKALSNIIKDEALVGDFLAVWPVVTSILEAFSNVTKLPIFIYLNDEKVYQSSDMPPFCAEMLNSPEMASRCVQDGLRRANKKEPDIHKRIQLCHAGMVNGRREIDTGCVGTLTILFGSKKSVTDEAIRRRSGIIQLASRTDQGLAKRLEKADALDKEVGDIEASDSKLIDAISHIIQRLLNATVGFRTLSINMAHELTLMMLGMGLHAKVLESLVERFQSPSDLSAQMTKLLTTKSHIFTECRLGLYIVRNFLSHASETRYKEAVSTQFKPLNLGTILSEMVELHKIQAAAKGVSFDVSGISDLPAVKGQEMELCRVFYNVLNNAIKYSYHSIPAAHRKIRIRAKIPYDSQHFSISIENYGLGLTKDELANAYKPGFRGKQAIAEVPIGAGIGLSEATKIMKAHRGKVRIRSEGLHEATFGGHTYLTTVDLIFPYKKEKDADLKRRSRA